ncbi:MAG: thiamine pyrophosphate-dependent enzyme [Methanotrichaceae archaeon]|nr:thiamine pyrophosphate-dependent enzyme [Methanotrichaceae archaeon]
MNANSEITTYAKNQWCPGCGNFGILAAMKFVLKELNNGGIPLENFVIITGIGQHAKMADYLNINSFYSIHGRTFPAATAIKLANPALKIICFAGDGDAYAEGIDHLIFSAKRNIDITAIIHDNRVYGLTTGQYTPTSPLGFKGKSTPMGSKENPINPLEIMLASGASFIARGYPGKMEHFKKLIKDAIMHKGFSFVDVLQVCVTYNNYYNIYNKQIYEVENNDLESFEQAHKIIKSWDYNDNPDVKIPIGKFYERDLPTFDEAFTSYEKHEVERNSKLKEMLENFV